MNLRQYLFIMIAATLMCWVSWFFVIFNVDPFDSKFLGFIFFYASLFLSLLGSVSIITFLLYHLFSDKNLPLFRYVEYSFRDAFVVSLIVILGLLMQAKNFFQYTWLIILVVIFLFLIIFFILSNKKQA